MSFCSRDYHVTQLIPVSYFLMEDRLFGQSEAQKRERERIKSEALSACAVEHKALTNCFKKSWFGWCRTEQSRFWSCYQKQRELFAAELLERPVPEGHWKDSSEKW